MKPTQILRALGQSLWLDNITRSLLASGTLSRYVRDDSVTGLTSNLTIFDHAIKNSRDYDDAILEKSREGKPARGALLGPGDRRSQVGRRPIQAHPRTV
jgi:transaldolase